MEENKSLLPPGGAPAVARCCCPAFIVNIVLTYEKQMFVLDLSIVLCDVSVVFPACNCLVLCICYWDSIMCCVDIYLEPIGAPLIETNE